MTAFDSRYLSQLIHDMHLGSADAYAAVFAGTLPDLYRDAWRQFQDIYLTQDALQLTYVSFFHAMNGIQTPRQFRKELTRINQLACEKIRNDRKEKLQKIKETKNEKITDPPEMTGETASQLLENVFEKSKMPLNTTSVEALASYNRYRKQRAGLLRVIFILAACMAVLAPLLFTPPSFTITEGDPDSRTGFPTYNLEISNRILPVKSIAAVIDEQSVPVYQTGAYTYRLNPSSNGIMTVQVTLRSNQARSETQEVSGIDATPPSVVSSLFRNGKLYLTLSDTGSGLDFDNIYVVNKAAKRYDPVYTNKVTGVVGFDTTERDLYLYASDLAGNIFRAHLHLEPKGETGDDG